MRALKIFWLFPLLLVLVACGSSPPLTSSPAVPINQANILSMEFVEHPRDLAGKRVNDQWPVAAIFLGDNTRYRQQNLALCEAFMRLTPSDEVPTSDKAREVVTRMLVTSKDRLSNCTEVLAQFDAVSSRDILQSRGLAPDRLYMVMYLPSDAREASKFSFVLDLSDMTEGDIRTLGSNWSDLLNKIQTASGSEQAFKNNLINAIKGLLGKVELVSCFVSASGLTILYPPAAALIHATCEITKAHAGTPDFIQSILDALRKTWERLP